MTLSLLTHVSLYLSLYTYIYTAALPRSLSYSSICRLSMIPFMWLFFLLLGY